MYYQQFQKFQKYFQKKKRNEKWCPSYLCGYRKGYFTKHALISMIKKRRKIGGRKEYPGAILMDLS